jgi:uncharacterized protein (TIGR03067 family)
MSIRAVEERALGDLIIRFRFGEYIVLNGPKLEEDMNKLDEISQKQAENYIVELSKTHTLGFREVVRGMIGPLGDEFGGHDKRPGSPSVVDDKDQMMEKEMAKLQGTWKVVSATMNGRELEKEKLGYDTMVIKGDVSTVMFNNERRVSTFAINPNKTPKTIDANPLQGAVKGIVIHGIYSLEDDTLREAFAKTGQPAPKVFEGDILILEFRRVSPLAETKRP